MEKIRPGSPSDLTNNSTRLQVAGFASLSFFDDRNEVKMVAKAGCMLQVNLKTDG